ncbi:MAG: DUF493 domain-containing protein [Crocinitomicaceae bacterium]
MSDSDSYEKLRMQLENMNWPEIYFFKFIVPNDSELVAKVTALFDEGTDLRLQQSKNGRYISVGAKEMMISPESVIQRYKEASNIKGLIAL